MNPYDSGEIGREDPELDRVARELERHAAAMDVAPPLGLAGRILSTIDDEPMPGSRWAWLGDLRAPARLLAAAVLVVAIIGALAIGSLIERARPDFGGQPTPAVLPTPSVTASPSPSPSDSPSATPSPSPSASPSATAEPTATARPTPSDDDDEVETPEPSESDRDNSGPGGGGDDDNSNSGPGGGGGGGGD